MIGRLTPTEREDRPLKVTRAFSEVQLRFDEEKRESMSDPFREMLKFAWALSKRRGNALPRVALFMPSTS